MTAVSVHVVTVGSDGDALAEQLAEAGLTVSGPVSSDLQGLEAAITTAPGADAVCVLGALGARSPLATALSGMFEGGLPGYGEAYRRDLATTSQGQSALARVEAGLVDGKLVFGVPSAEAGCKRATALVVAALQLIEPSSSTADAVAPIPFGGARGSSMGLAMAENRPEVPAPRRTDDEEEDTGPEPGWQRAVHALGAEVMVGRKEDLPENIEKLAPVLNVLHTAGEHGMMKLPSGRRYSLWGWPDLRRSSSKVLAVSWGEPLAEVVALHRHPAEAGTCIEEDNGLLPSAGSDVAEICERVCGRAPLNTDGTVFAMSSDAVWILRSRRVFKWDGSREKDDGNPKQVLASLALHWSNR